MRPIVEWVGKYVVVASLVILVVVSITALAITIIEYHSGEAVERSYADILIDFQSMRINQLAEELRQAEQRILLCEGYVDE